MADYTLQINNNIIRQLNEGQMMALLKTGNSILVDVDAQETVPMDTGLLQQSGTVSRDGDNVKITYSTPYADIQYFDASLQHNQGPHAGTATDHWLDEYQNGGTKFDFVVDKYKAHYSSELRRIHL